jgi:DNA-binding NarL/FixJ family response regulator
MQKKIKIVLADDHNVVRQGLRALLMGQADMEVLGEASNGRQAVQLARQLHPDIVVMDIAMPLLNGLEATRQILKQSPAVKVLVLSSYRDDDYIEQLIEAGAAGYLIKQTAANDLLQGVREVNQGNGFFSPAIAKRLRDHCRGSFADQRPTAKHTKPLTSRESEVLQLIAEGQPNKQIAGSLCISVKTVEKHRQGLMAKLNIHNIAGLTRHAVEKGIIESNVATNPIAALPA